MVDTDQGDARGRDATPALPPERRLPDDLARILREAGAPLHYREILRRVEEQGIAITGRNPARTIITQLTGDERFRRVTRGVWTLEGDEQGGR